MTAYAVHRGHQATITREPRNPADALYRLNTLTLRRNVTRYFPTETAALDAFYLLIDTATSPAKGRAS
jgi:hypothetical protein